MANHRELASATRVAHGPGRWLLLVATVATVACGQKDPDDPVDGADLQPYFPLVGGAWWEYSHSDWDERVTVEPTEFNGAPMSDDLQYACTFDLPAPRHCTDADPSCDCASGSDAPLCSLAPGEQIKGKAYPTLRPLRVARALGERGIIGSICAPSYVATIKALSARLAPRLAN